MPDQRVSEIKASLQELYARISELRRDLKPDNGDFVLYCGVIRCQREVHRAIAALGSVASSPNVPPQPPPDP